ncbi:MAG: pentapeptide repeat-containing protein [Cyanobacteria bacterium P01_C01_bin.118]
MFQGITQWLWQRDRGSVALPVVTACSLLLTYGSTAYALDESDLKRLIETNECPGCDLQAADLRRLDLSGANLEGANLEGANFFYAVLDGANLSGADLRFSNLAYVSALPRLSDALDSSGRRLEFPALFVGANLERALLTYADFSGADMQEANFFEAYVFSTRFLGSQLQRTNFDATLVHDVDLRGANLCGSTYWGGNDYRRACNVPVTDIDDMDE